MKEIYLLGVFNKNNELQRFIRTSRNNTIPAFNSIIGAKRCFGQVKNWCDINKGESVKIITASNLRIVEEVL